MKRHPNSLAARISRKHGEAYLDEVIARLVLGHVTLEDMAGELHEAGVDTSSSSVARLVSTEGLRWRINRAREAAEATKDSLPGDWKDQVKRGLAQKTFELAFDDLNLSELVKLKRVQLQEAQQQLDERRIAILEAKFKEASGVADDRKLTDAEKTARMKEIFGIAS